MEHGKFPRVAASRRVILTWSKLPRIVCHLLATNNHIATTSILGHYNCFAVCRRRLDIASTNADEGNDRMIKSLVVCTLLLCTCAFADNGHLLGTSKTEQYNVAVFAEPWPARVGRLQLQFIVTDNKGNIVEAQSIIPLAARSSIELPDIGPFAFTYTVDGTEQQAIRFDVLPVASPLVEFWHIWLFLIIGVILIILREKLAKNMQERYPST